MSRPSLHDPAASEAAEAVVRRFAAELQKAGEDFDADGYDRSFADDVLWGSPFGATLAGFAPLNAVHHQLMDAARTAEDPDAPPRGAPASRFEVVAVRVPSPGVIVAQIRRQAIVAGGFSEMALYVLVARDGEWWLAAAQNTPIGQAPA